MVLLGEARRDWRKRGRRPLGGELAEKGGGDEHVSMPMGCHLVGSHIKNYGSYI